MKGYKTQTPQEKMQDKRSVGGSQALAPAQLRTSISLEGICNDQTGSLKNDASQDSKKEDQGSCPLKSEDFIEIFRKYSSNDVPHFCDRHLFAWIAHIPDQHSISIEQDTTIPNPEKLAKNKQYRIVKALADTLNRNFQKRDFQVATLYRNGGLTLFLTTKLNAKISQDERAEMFQILSLGIQKPQEFGPLGNRFMNSRFYCSIVCDDGYLALTDGEREIQVKAIHAGYSIEDKGPVTVKFARISTVTRESFQGACDFKGEQGRSVKFAFTAEFRPLITLLASMTDISLTFNEVRMTSAHRLDLVPCEKLVQMNLQLGECLNKLKGDNLDLF